VFKRVALFLAVNLAVMVVLSVVYNVLMNVLVPRGIVGPEFMRAYFPLLIFAAIFGFGGSIVSLFISKWMAKWSTGAKVIDSPRNQTEAWLVETVRRHAQRAGIGMPEVAIYEAPEMNAFATGATKNSSLVAVSTGLLQQMEKDEVDAVLGHEIAHVANGDMVTLTLIQGVLNTFVLFFSRVIGGLVDSFLRKDGERGGRGIGYWVATIFAELVLGVLAMIIVMWFSRWREFRADHGGAELSGRRSMINALKRLSRGQEAHLPESLAAFGISGKRSGFARMFMSHPPIEERIARLEQAQIA
jgi:heat shock protein HtpX